MFLGNQVYVVLDKAKANFLFIIPVASRQRPRMPLLKIEEDTVGHQFPILCFARQKKEEKHGVREGYHRNHGYLDIFFHFKPHVHCTEKESRVFRGRGQAALLTLLPSPKKELQEGENPKHEKKTE
jgi:hypothetical protein